MKLICLCVKTAAFLLGMVLVGVCLYAVSTVLIGVFTFL